MADLKPCPFCGREKIGIFTTEDLGMDYGEFGYFAVCDVTSGGCGAASGWHATEDEAEEAWNRRVENG